jgi:hypothetical protein
LVVVESGRGALLESKDAHIHYDHVLANDCIKVVEAVGSKVPFLLVGGLLAASSLSFSGAEGASKLLSGSSLGSG